MWAKWLFLRLRPSEAHSTSALPTGPGCWAAAPGGAVTDSWRRKKTCRQRLSGFAPRMNLSRNPNWPDIAESEREGRTLLVWARTLSHLRYTASNGRSSWAWRINPKLHPGQ